MIEYFERIISNKTEETLIFISKPYREIKFTIIFLIVILLSSLCVYFLFNFNLIEKIEYFDNKIFNFIFIYFFMGFIVSYSISILPLTLTFFKFNFLYNLFLTEELVLTKNRIIFKKNNSIKFDQPLFEMKELYVDFNKKNESFYYIPYVMLDYKPVIEICFKNKKNTKKIFKSLKKNEIAYLFRTIEKRMNSEGLLYDERQYEFNTLNLHFLSVKEFYTLNKHYFLYHNLDLNVEQLDNKKSNDYQCVIKNFHLITEHKRKINKFSLMFE